MGYNPLFYKKVNSLVTLLFIIGMLITLFFKELNVWDSVIICFGAALAIRQYLVGKIIDIIVTVIIFTAIFIFNNFYYCELSIFILLLVAALYIMIRQYLSIYKHRCDADWHSKKFNNEPH